MLEEEIEEVELSSQRDFDGPPTFQPFSDNDTTTLFQDLERELEKMVQKYHVPPTDLENLFQVRCWKEGRVRVLVVVVVLMCRWFRIYLK